MRRSARKVHWAFCLVLLQALAACTGGPDKRDPGERLLSMPARKLSSYPATLNLPLEQRIGDTPRVFLDSLRDMDRDPSYTDYTLTPGQHELVVQYLGLLPARGREVMEERLIGLYFVADLLGTGLTDWVLDQDGGFFVVMAFNPACLTADMSQWMTARERTAFQGDGASVTIDCGTDYAGFLYGILHETAHAVDYVDRVTPYTEPVLVSALALPPLSRDPVFTTAAWKDYSVPMAEYDSPLRGKIGFYGVSGPARLTQADAKSVYEWLDGSPFVSIYGAQTWAEDLAESVTWYHFVSVLGGTYTVVVTDESGATHVLNPEAKMAGRPGWSFVVEHMYGE